MSNKGYANNYYVPNRIGATKQYNNNTQVQINIPQRGQKITFATISEGLLEDSCRMNRLLHSATKQIINIIIIIIIIVIKIIIIPNIDYS
jgi:hypothetical protein